MSFKKIKTLLAVLTAGALAAGSLSGCGDTAKGASDPTSGSDTQETLSIEAEDMFTDRDKEVGYDESSAVTVTLTGDTINCSDSSAKVMGSTITFTKEGVYLISGSLSDGQIIVDADKSAKLQLVFDGVDITSATSAPLYVKTADKVFVTLADGSSNRLSTTSEFAAIDDSNIDATIFAKADLSLNGSGSLTISCASGHGIVSKDDLVITGGSYDITASKHALSGKDSVRIADGTLNLTAGKDGIHSENTEDMDKGFIYVSGGDIHITCSSDGLDGDNTVQIEGGNIEIAAGDDGIHSDSDLIITDGTISVTKSYEGLEGMTIAISGGDIRVVSSDDGLNAAGAGKGQETDAVSSATVNPGNAENKPDKGDLQLPDSQPEPPSDIGGMELPQAIEAPADGQPDQPSDQGDFRGHGGFGNRDDFGNREDLGDRGNFGGRGGFGGGGGGFDQATSYNKITISGGTLLVDAGGDGIDSNGDLIVTGGEIYVYGPTNSGNGALDYAGSGTITGGTIIAVGASGMAKNFGTDSTQGSMLITTGSSLVTGEVTLTGADGRKIISCTPTKGYNSVLISAPELAAGETYTLTAGSTAIPVNMESLIYSNASEGGMRGQGGRFGI